MTRGGALLASAGLGTAIDSFDRMLQPTPIHLTSTSMPGTLIRPLMDNKISTSARSDLGLNLIVSLQL